MSKESEDKDRAPSFEGRFERLRAYFKRRPGSSLRTLYADVERMEGLRSYAVSDKFTIEADEPEGLGGTDEAPSPTQLLLAALGHCQAITLRMYSDAMGIGLASIKVKVTGTVDIKGYFSVLDDDGVIPPSNLEEVVIRTFIESKEPKDRIMSLIEASTGRGVCLSTVGAGTRMRLTYRLNGKRLDI